MTTFKEARKTLAKIQTQCMFYRAGLLSDRDFSKKVLALVDELEAEADAAWARIEEEFSVKKETA